MAQNGELMDAIDLPIIKDHDSFVELLEKFAIYIQDSVQFTCSFENLRSSSRSKLLNQLVQHLVDNTDNQRIIAALLALRSYFTNLKTDDEPGINQTRAYACEFVAWRLLLYLSEREAIDCLLEEYDLSQSEIGGTLDEESTLLRGPTLTSPSLNSLGRHTPRPKTVGCMRDSSGLKIGSLPDLSSSVGSIDSHSLLKSQEFASYFDKLNALEIAAVSGSKKFLSQRVVQKIIEKIWRGDIVFWESLSVNANKSAKLYNKRKADPFVRLRVPRYLKFFEAVFFASFLALYYAVLVPIQRSGRPKSPPSPPQVVFDGQTASSTLTGFHTISPAEVLLYVWIAGFAYDEFGEYRDAGQAFYAADFWSVWDLGIVFIGFLFFITRTIGLMKQSDDIIGVSFDILSLEALFLVPRICSLLSLNSYFGTLIPCLREMTKDFVKFLSLVAILYIGFLTTFTLLARDNFSAGQMSWILVKVFFGSSYLGFDVAQDISPLLGPPLMLIFVCLTNVLLITSLISLLSASLAKVLDHAREEYLFIYSVYVLEASTSNRLTYFLPPLNLIPLLLRPLRPITELRGARIVLLKITHSPFVAAIWAYENIVDYLPLASTFGPEASTASLQGPSSTNTPVRAGKQPRPMFLRTSTATSQHRNQSSLDPAGVGMDPTEAEDLRSLVLKLMGKVDNLTAQMAEQQQQKNKGIDVESFD